MDMLQAMNTGHEGSMSTGHANSARDMLSRLETMVLSGAELPIPVIRKQISVAIDIMVQLSRMRDHSRKVVEISEVLDVSDGEIQLNPLFQFVESEPIGESNMGQLKATGNKLINKYKFDMAGMKLPRVGEESR